VRFILGRLNAATDPRDMDLPGLSLHELHGDRKGTWAVKVGGNWRVTFGFAAKDAVVTGEGPRTGVILIWNDRLSRCKMKPAVTVENVLCFPRSCGRVFQRPQLRQFPQARRRRSGRGDDG
jgi:RelE-like toxin of type II toxin-antitoxin system HigB